jgi:tetraacyldisaccharide 4'-kinase
VVSRGYGRRSRGLRVVADSHAVRAGADEAGDEPLLLARRLPGTPVVVSEHRYEAARHALTRLGATTIVLDDGFQHRALARDADLVLVTADAATAWMLPAGPLREPPSGLARARALLAIDGPPPAVTLPAAGVFRGRLRPTGLVRVEGGAWVEEPLAGITGRRVVAVAGIARPERVADTLAGAGAVVDRLLAFPDHHDYGERDVALIVAAAARGTVVTTEKDLVKLARFPALGSVRAVRVALEVEDGAALVDLLTGPLVP